MSFVNNKKGKRFDTEKKILPNKKYDHIQHTVDTGSSMSKYMKKVEDIQKNYKFRKDEIFKRMKATTFVQLVVQVEYVSGRHDEDYGSIPPTPASERPDTGDRAADREIQAIQGMRQQPVATPTPSLALTEGDYGFRAPDTQRSSLQSVMRGIGEMDMKQSQPSHSAAIVEEEEEDCPYLLLDVRDADEYEIAHIIRAYSYPKALLSRATNYETQEMLQYRNKDGKIIVIYDEDEKIASNAATTLVQRGYDNLFMLSGGIKVAYKLFPEGLITGTMAPTKTQQKMGEFPGAEKTRFDKEDVEKLEMYLDNSLVDKSSASRLSQPSSRNSNVSRKSNTSSLSHKKPFLPV